MKSFIRILSSNFRANQREGRIFSGDSFPIWSEGDQSNWRFQWASWYLYEMYGYELPLHSYNVIQFPTTSLEKVA